MCLLSFTCNYVASVRRGFLFLLVLGMGCVILSWRSLGLPYNCFAQSHVKTNAQIGCSTVQADQRLNVSVPIC